MAPDDANDQALGRVLKAFRLKLKLTQTDVAERIGINQKTISDYESGAVSMNATRILELEKALDQPRGAFWAAAGLGEPSSQIVRAVLGDTSLTGESKRSLLLTYEDLRSGEDGAGGVR